MLGTALATIVATGLGSAVPAAADTGTAELLVTAVHVERITLPAGATATVELSDLAPATAEPVLHLIDAATNSAIAGARGVSRTVVGVSPSDRELVLIVRALSSDGTGTATLSITTSATREISITFAGIVHAPPSLVGARRLLVGERPGGPADLVALVVDGADPTRLLAFDDDSGTGLAPVLALDLPCPAGCALVVAHKPGDTDGPALIAWDAGDTDSDADGLSDALEAELGTAPGLADTDADGLTDGAELFGVDGPAPVLLPRWGADPNAPDLFVELDWEECDPVTDWCGPHASRDRHRSSGAAARRLANFFAPEITVHLDNGVASDDPASVVHGDWGGAERQPLGQHPCNADILGARFGIFHRGVASPLGSGGGGTLYGYCFGGDGVRMGVLAQELGHNFGLDHGGNAPSLPANCKPHYLSPMNYAYTYDMAVVEFSRGRLAGSPLNGVALDELAGLGTTDPALLDRLRGGAFGLNVRDDGAIDWNRDGRFDPLVRGAPTWGYASCEQSKAHADALGAALDPELSWLPGDGAPDRLYLLSRSAIDGRLDARFTTRLDRCDRTVDTSPCTDWSPVEGEPARLVDRAPPGRLAPAAEWVVDADGTHRLLVVQLATDGQLYVQRLTATATGEDWDEPLVLDSDSDVIVTGSPTLRRAPDGTLVLLAPAGGVLLRWQLDDTGRPTAPPTVESWEDGTPIVPCGGVTLARGHRADLAEEALFAAIAAGPFCTVELARFDADDGDGAAVWERTPATSWPAHRPMTDVRPGLAWVPLDPLEPRAGRFYLAWTPWPSGAVLITHTEGDDPSPDAESRRLRFLSGTFFSNVWGLGTGAVTLAHDPARDTNLRAAWSFGARSSLGFYPFADGIIDRVLLDQDDYGYLLETLACSLTASCTP